MSLKLFITGTDTGVGKTIISVALLKLCHTLGYKTIGIKPVATGCFEKNNRLYNSDALALQQAASIPLAYDYINPFRFVPAIAPHIAAQRLKQKLTINKLKEKTAFALNYAADISIIEGVGGWHVPLNYRETMADFVIQQQFSVILVVGIRLGCLNHAILTYQAIKTASVTCAGWIANCLLPHVEESTDIIQTLKRYLKIPFLGTVGYQENPEEKITMMAIF